MAGTASRGFGFWGSTLESSSSQRCQYGELVAECRSSEQLENETPSISEDDESGLKPSDLYGKFTWKIDKFSQINKRELHSRTFEVGGYNWYILIYPQGCDVCHHLSLFLCVADHDKLLPGWSHSALFTISVVSKDPMNSKYSDTVHRFWKKEHDWGWKKFMELPKVLDEFLDNDTLIIKAQVQVIREKANCPFRCLDIQYKRELARVYLTQVEQIFRQFVEERREKLVKLIENKARWSSFCSFWQQIDESTRKWMSSEIRDIILRRVVKQFFVENEVTSILVMDSLYFGMKALEGRYSYAKDRRGVMLYDEPQAPIARAENEVFVLADDVVPIIERVVMEPSPPKDEKGPQQLRTKDGGSGDDSCKNMNEPSDRRLAELGRKTLEIYILGHIFSNRVEIAYQEAVSLQMQEDLIREEAEYETVRQKSSGKEKKPKKKQAKQKRSNKKEKEKMNDKKHGRVTGPNAGMVNDMEDYVTEVVLPTNPEHLDASEDISNLEDKIASFLSGEFFKLSNHNSTDTHGGTVSSFSGTGGKMFDKSSSTCSTGSISSVILNSSVVSSPQYKMKSVPRKKNQQLKGTIDEDRLTGLKGCQLPGPVSDKRHQNDESISSKVATKEDYKSAPSRQDEGKLFKQHVAIKEILSPEKKKIMEKSTAAASWHPRPLKRATASGPAKLPSQTSANIKSNAKTNWSSVGDVPITHPVPLSPDIAMQRPGAVSGKRTENLRGPLLANPSSAHVAKSTQLSGNCGQTSCVGSFAPQSYKSAVMQSEEGSSPSSSTSLPSSASCSAPRCPKSSVSAPSWAFYTSFDPSGALKVEDQWMNPKSPTGNLQQLSLGSYWCSGSSLENLNAEFVRAGCQTQADEFPHLDLINYVLDDEH